MANVAHPLLDTLIERMALPNDAGLARAMEVPRPQISNIRHGRLKVGATLLLRMHEASGMAFSEMRTLAAA